MKAELDRTAFRGVLPLIYTFIALTGGEVVSTQLRRGGRQRSCSRAGQLLSDLAGRPARGSSRVSRPRTQRRPDPFLCPGKRGRRCTEIQWSPAEMGGRLWRRQRLSEGGFVSAPRIRISPAFVPSFSITRFQSCRMIREFPFGSFRTVTGASGCSAPTRERWTSSRSTIKAIFRRPSPRPEPRYRCLLEPVTSGDLANRTCFWPSSSRRRHQRRPFVALGHRRQAPSGKTCRRKSGSRKPDLVPKADDDKFLRRRNVNALAARADHGYRGRRARFWTGRARSRISRREIASSTSISMACSRSHAAS